MARFRLDGPLAHWLAAAGLYLVACVIMLDPLVDFRHLHSASLEGDARLVIWILGWNNHAVLDGVPSLFDANIFHPEPNTLALGEHLFGISLFTLPVYAATRNPVLAYNVVWLLSFLLSALAAHLLAWRVTRDHLAAGVAGLVYAFCFFKMQQGHAHLHIVWAFWIPLSLVLIDRWFHRPTWPRLTALFVCVALQALASWYLAVMVLVADALWLTWLGLEHRLSAPDTNATGVGRIRPVQVVVACGLGAALLWPFAGRYGALLGGSPAEAAAGSADLAAYLVPPENTWLGQILIASGSLSPRWIWGERTLYLGCATLALAGIGIMRALGDRTGSARLVRFSVALGLVALALSLGPASPQSWGWTPFGMFVRLPGMQLFRVPARFALLLTLALAVLAAAGASSLHRRFGAIGRAVTFLLLPLLLTESFVVQFPGGGPRPFPIPPVYRYLATLPAGAAVSLPDFLLTPAWFREADYLYYSTAHWRPIVNGYARTTPRGFPDRIRGISTFPSTQAADLLRSLGVAYVIVHGAELPDRGDAVFGRAREGEDFVQLARFGEDYLFRVNAK